MNHEELERQFNKIHHDRLVSMLQAIDTFLSSYNVRSHEQDSAILVRGVYRSPLLPCTAWVMCTGNEIGSTCLADPQRIKTVGKIDKADNYNIRLELGSVKLSDIAGTIKRI